MRFLHKLGLPRVDSLLLPSPSLSFSGWSLGVQRLSAFTFLPGLLRPNQEGALCLHSSERAPVASVNRASPLSGTLLAFCVNQRISASILSSLIHSFIRSPTPFLLRVPLDLAGAGPQHMTPLPFTLLFWVQVYTPFSCFLSREYRSVFVGELVCWCWILSAFACL